MERAGETEETSVMMLFEITNLRTGEVRYARDYNNVWACEQYGWRLSHCEAKVVEEERPRYLTRSS